MQMLLELVYVYKVKSITDLWDQSDQFDHQFQVGLLILFLLSVPFVPFVQ
jgi:hypothetical protein